MADFEYPDDLRYTSEHEWVRAEGGRVRVGITAYAQDALGDIVYVQLPDAGSTVEAGSAVGEVESTKSVSDLYAPISGTVVERNEALDATPELVNTDPYGQGWMFEVEPADAAAVDGLLTADQYRGQLS
ncbi:MAG TPA: glycine cleavage system protein GcvH [Kineosporiaceae bacterium]|nr:glycine cleavage system protein GcvH [Kineosporiaceae bacterium]